jgi:MprA protease rhombosortase-interaction domain-containing protein
MRRISMWLAALLLASGLLAPTRRASAQGYVVVTNTAGPATLSRNEVARIFLKKSAALVPVDLGKGSKVRAAFSRAIVGRPVTAVLTYWQQQIFAGQESPPAEKATDADVLAFVRGNPRAIGYVSMGAALGDGVHAVTVQ